MNRTHTGSEEGIGRRTVLRNVAVAGAVGAAGTGPAAAGGCDAVVDADGGGDYTAIQDAVDDASAGQTICVAAGTYEEAVDVDVDVTLRGRAPPDGPSAAVVDGSVSVSADGATVAGLRVAPTATLTPGGLDPHGVLVTASDVAVAGNVVTGMEADAAAGVGSVTINGIQVWNGGPEPLSGVVVRGNVVRDLHNRGAAGWPNYGGAAGLKVQGVVDGVEVVGNRVADLHSAGWAWGIVLTHTGNAPAVSPRNVAVRSNVVAAVNDGSVYDVAAAPTSAPYPGAAFGVDGNATADQATVRHNDLVRSPVGAHNKDGAHVLDAACNYWGHATGPDADGTHPGKGTGVAGEVAYRPWSVRSAATGNHPGNACVGGRGSRGNGRGR